MDSHGRGGAGDWITSGFCCACCRESPDRSPACRAGLRGHCPASRRRALRVSSGKRTRPYETRLKQAAQSFIRLKKDPETDEKTKNNPERKAMVLKLIKAGSDGTSLRRRRLQAAEIALGNCSATPSPLAPSIEKVDGRGPVRRGQFPVTPLIAHRPRSGSRVCRNIIIQGVMRGSSFSEDATCALTESSSQRPLPTRCQSRREHRYRPFASHTPHRRAENSLRKGLPHL